MDVLGAIDPRWIGVCLTALAIVMGYYQFRKGRTPSPLHYSISVQPLLGSLSPSAVSSLTVNNRRLVKPYFATIVLRNVGHLAVRPEDFTDPLSLRVSIPTGGIVDARAYHFPAGGKYGHGIEFARLFPNAVFFKPMVMNPGDMVQVRLVIDGGDPAPNVEGQLAGFRIVDPTVSRVSTARRKVLGTTKEFAGYAFGFALLCSVLLSIFYLYAQPAYPDVVGKTSQDAVDALTHVGVHRDEVTIQTNDDYDGNIATGRVTGMYVVEETTSSSDDRKVILVVAP